MCVYMLSILYTELLKNEFQNPDSALLTLHFLSPKRKGFFYLTIKIDLIIIYHSY